MHGESIAFSEQPEKPPMSFHGLEPYEIKHIDGAFVACLPIAGIKNAKNEPSAMVYGEISFPSYGVLSALGTNASLFSR